MDTALVLTAKIVSAHVSSNNIESDRLPDLICSVYNALTAKPADAPAVPAVPISKSVFRDRVICLECGNGFRTLKRHLEREHGIDAEGYRNRFGLRSDHPLAAPEFREERARIAKRIGLGKGRVSRWK